MRCVAVDPSTGAVYVQHPEPADVSSCALVLASPGEIGASPFSLDVPAASAIGAAILTLWAVAWGIRSAIQTLRS